VARTEHLTYICSPEKEDAGPTNNWMDPGAAKHKVGALLDGAMRGRTMYVVPYVMGPVSSPISKVGVEATDSPYVVASMRIMSRMGKVAMERLGRRASLFRIALAGRPGPHAALHCALPAGKINLERGVGLRRNALLGKMFCFADCQRNGARAGLDGRTHADPGAGIAGRQVTYMAAAFRAHVENEPAMMVSALEGQGYRVWTVGDDISWMKIGEDGYLRAINPEAGFFWRGPRHGMKTQSERNGSAAQEHAIYERGDDFGTGAVVGRNWQRGAGGTDQLEGRGVGPVQRSGGASECAIHRAGKTVAKYFTEVGSARRRADFSVHFWRAKSTCGAAGVRIV